MPEDAPTPNAPETDPAATGATGTVVDGGAGGTQPSAESAAAFAAEKDRFESTIRTLQSDKDKAWARVRELEAASAPKPEPATGTPATMAEFQAMLDRRDALRDAVSALKTEFPQASPDLFSKAMSYDSPEALRVAVEESHAAELAKKSAVRAEIEAEVRAAYAERFGELPEAPAGSEAGAGNGLPTAAQARDWSFSEINAFIAEHGQEAWDRIVRSS